MQAKVIVTPCFSYKYAYIPDGLLIYSKITAPRYSGDTFSSLIVHKLMYNAIFKQLVYTITIIFLLLKFNFIIEILYINLILF